MTMTVARVSLLGCLCLSTHFALATEPESSPAFKPARGVGQTILSKLPYLGKLFGVEVECESCDVDSPPLCEPQEVIWRSDDGQECIGVDFECELARHRPPYRGEIACPASKAVCSANETICADKMICPANKTICPANNAAACAPACQPAAGPVAFAPAGPPAFPMALTPPGVCGPHGMVVDMQGAFGFEPGMPMAGMFEAVMGARMEAFGAIEEFREQARERENELMCEIVKARVAAAVAQTKLKAREEAAATEAGLRKELAAAHLDTLKLAARLEVAMQKEQLTAELLEARAELAALKAKSAAEEQTARRAVSSRR